MNSPFFSINFLRRSLSGRFFSGRWVLSGVLLSLLLGTPTFAIELSEKRLMEEARTAYESGKIDRAIELYQKIPQSSDFWVEALEEQSWSHLRKNNASRALSLITTLTSDFLAPQVGPEPYFLRGLINYRLCNIKGIFQDFELFKKRFKTRLTELEKLKNTGTNKAVPKALEILLKFQKTPTRLSADDFGPDIQFLPLSFYRDSLLLANLSIPQPEKISNRLQQLASSEIKDIETVLQKMHLLESQVVQQVFAYNQQMQSKKEAQFAPKDPNSLFFPYKNTNDIWIDEIDNFEAATSDCPVDPLKGETL